MHHSTTRRRPNVTLNGLRNNVLLKLNGTMFVFIVAKETYPYRAFAKFTQHNFNNQTVTLLLQTVTPPPPHLSLVLYKTGS